MIDMTSMIAIARESFPRSARPIQALSLHSALFTAGCHPCQPKALHGLSVRLDWLCEGLVSVV